MNAGAAPPTTAPPNRTGRAGLFCTAAAASSADPPPTPSAATAPCTAAGGRPPRAPAPGGPGLRRGKRTGRPRPKCPMAVQRRAHERSTDLRVSGAMTPATPTRLATSVWQVRRDQKELRSY